MYAAKATAVDSTVLRVSFPPKPPPILFTRTTIRLSGTPNIFATKLYAEGKKSIYPCIDASSGLFPGLTFTCPTCLGLSTALHPSIPGRKILLTYQCCLVPGSNTHWSLQTESGNSTRGLAFNHTDKTAACFQSKSSSYLPWAFRSEKEEQILKALATSVILQVIKKNPSCGC